MTLIQALSLPSIPTLTTLRLTLDAFTTADIPALAGILAEPEVTKTITANASTPARCRKAAAHRIDWHNRSWETHGYGVWAIRSRDNHTGDTHKDKQGALIGWCGFSEPDIGNDPEILYGLAQQYWGKGLAQEAAIAAITWLFAKPGRPRHSGISAVVFGRLNPASLTLAGKLGFERKGRMTMANFLPDRELAKEVLDYELWRLEKAPLNDAASLLFQTAFKAGQIASLNVGDVREIEQALCDAACRRSDLGDMDPAESRMRIRIAYWEGLADPYLDWLHRGR